MNASDIPVGRAAATAEIPRAVLAKFFEAPDSEAPNPAPPQTGDGPAGAAGLLYRSPGRPGLPASALTVLGVAPDEGACGHYRVRYPLMCLAAQGARVEVRRADAPIPLESFLGANVLYLSRAYTDAFRRDVQAVARLSGATVVYDLDDCLHHVSRTSPAFPAYDPAAPAGRSALDSISRFMAAADGAIFSTRELQAQYEHALSRDGGPARSSHVLFNGLDLALGERDWDLEAPRFNWRALAERQGCAVDADSLLFGWAGSNTHYDSLLELGDAVARVLARTENTFFGLFTDPHLACHFCVERWGLPLRRVVFLPPAPFGRAPRVLSAFDLALAPLRNDVFNRCKSCLRLLEHGAWGTPYVASPVAPYWRFHRETGGRGGEVARAPAEFAAHAVRLLEDPDGRRERGAFLARHVRARHDVRTTAAPLLYTLRAIQESRGTVLPQPSWRSIEDAWAGVPKAAPAVDAGAPCPCGSGRPYGECPNGCPPAFGELEDGDAPGEGRGNAAVEGGPPADGVRGGAEIRAAEGEGGAMTVIAATLLCDRKAADQLTAVPAVLAMEGVIRLYVSVQTDGAADFAPLEAFLAAHPTPSLVEPWHRGGWEGAFPEDDRDQRRLLGIVTARNMALDYALGQGADWLLFVDADVVPAPDGLRRLLALGRPLCGGLVPGRGEHAPIHYVFPGHMADPDWDLPVTEENGVIRCAFGTCGYMLIHWSVFSRLRFRFNPLARPGSPAMAEDPAYCLDAVRLGLADAFYIDRRATARHASREGARATPGEGAGGSRISTAGDNSAGEEAGPATGHSGPAGEGGRPCSPGGGGRPCSTT
ncbi:MAG: glycosyltransferase [Armatimonadetes bacterium]|nr:glycosyltransferase [Armatimonadota bacterium]